MNDADLLHFGTRILRDAMNEATSAYWLRRAEQFEAARPQPGDRLGTNGRRGAAEIDARCAAMARACRAKAAALRLSTDDDMGAVA